ncbi:MAG: helix-turn-helix domain-containing protein [Polyangiaceae bacterium]
MTLAPSALRKLGQHSWPGNVRELENVLTKAVVLAERDELGGDDIEVGRPRVEGSGPPSRTRRWTEKSELLAALERARWNAVRAAKDLGMPRATFYRKLREAGIARPKPTTQ